MNAQDELVVIRHTMAALRTELEYLNMCARDYGVNELSREICNTHADMYSVGMRLKHREAELLKELGAQ